ncbi:hypothetical protein ACMHYB_60215 [Sorangium sp. So ce1128]
MQRVRVLDAAGVDTPRAVEGARGVLGRAEREGGAREQDLRRGVPREELVGDARRLARRLGAVAELRLATREEVAVTRQLRRARALPDRRPPGDDPAGARRALRRPTRRCGGGDEITAVLSAVRGERESEQGREQQRAEVHAASVPAPRSGGSRPADGAGLRSG